MKGTEGAERGLRSGGRGWHSKASVSSAGRELFDDPSYVNVQNLDKARQAGAGAGPPNPAINGSAPRDLFDMSECACRLSVSPSSHLVPPLLLPLCSFLPGLPSLKAWVLSIGLCQLPLLALSLYPQSPLKMPCECLHLPSQ